MRNHIHDGVLEQIRSVFDRRLIENNLRGLYAECLVATLLGGDWRQTGVWEYWDLEHVDGTKLEVKQSTAMQTWHELEGYEGPSRPNFSIAPTRREMADGWSDPQRYSGIYVFAWHGRYGCDADHRDVDQWEFYVVKALELPASQRSISINPLKRLTNPVSGADLRVVVENMRQSISSEFAPMHPA